MLRFLVNCFNGALLVIVFIGVPAVTNKQFGHLQISSLPSAEKLMFWGLAVGIAVNVFVATIFPSGIKTRILCAKWAFAFSGLLLLEHAYIQGYLNFDWLKKSLAWLQKRF